MKTMRLVTLSMIIFASVPRLSYGLFTFSGVRNNLPISSLAGWTVCHQDFYDNSTALVATIMPQCSGSQLLMACRPAFSST